MSNVFKTIKTYKDVFFITIGIVLISTNVYLRGTNAMLKKSVEKHYSNELAYQNIVSDKVNENLVLRMTAIDMQNSYDKVVVKMNATMDSLQIARNKLKVASNITQKIDTTIVTSIEYKDTTTCDFTKIIEPNDLTKIKVAVERDSLSLTLDIKNDQSLYVYNKRIYRNPNKNFFKRLITFDWKKINTVNYIIHNSNDLIKVTDTRVIEITEK